MTVKQRPLLGNSRQHTRTQQYNNGVSQAASKQRIGKHAYNNSGVVGNGVFYSVRTK
jgi:hypothetical protein